MFFIFHIVSTAALCRCDLTNAYARDRCIHRDVAVSSRFFPFNIAIAIDDAVAAAVVTSVAKLIVCIHVHACVCPVSSIVSVSKFNGHHSFELEVADTYQSNRKKNEMNRFECHNIKGKGWKKNIQ